MFKSCSAGFSVTDFFEFKKFPLQMHFPPVVCLVVLIPIETINSKLIPKASEAVYMRQWLEFNIWLQTVAKARTDIEPTEELILQYFAVCKSPLITGNN